MPYTIGEMARKLGVAPSALRYYEKEGLLPFVERSEGGIRVFQEGDYELLKIIDCMKATGMQLKDIRQFVILVMEGDASIDARLALFQKQRAAVEQQLVKLQETLDTVRFKCWYYETAKACGTTEVPEQMRTDELPEEFREIRERLRKE